MLENVASSVLFNILKILTLSNYIISVKLQIIWCLVGEMKTRQINRTTQWRQLSDCQTQ